MKKEEVIELISKLSEHIDDVDALIADTGRSLTKIIDILSELPSDVKEIEDDEDEEKPED